MALITDPDLLAQGVEVTLTPGTKRITLNLAGDLSEDGVTLKCLYSFLKEEWKNDSSLIAYPFPMVAITPEQFEFVNDWEPANDATRKLIRTGGWREIDAASAVKREYLGIISLGDIDAVSKTSGDKAYYAFASDSARTEFTYAGPVNEAIQTYGNAANGNFDKRGDVIKTYIRIQGKTYQLTDTDDIGVDTSGTNTTSYIVYRFPLSEATDLNIATSDGDIDTLAPYTGMSITYYGTDQSLAVGGSNYNFRVVIDGNGGTKEQIYEYVQRQLRRNSDIDAGAGTVNGFLAEDLVEFVGSTLKTKLTSIGGVYITDFDTNDTNDIALVDNTGTERTFPFVAAGTIGFNQNLVSDSDGRYWMFFEYTLRKSVADLAISSASGATATLSSAGGNLPVTAQNDYINVLGATNPNNNGIWQVTSASPTTSTFNATKINGLTVANQAAFAGTVDLNPINSPDAIIVDNDAGTDIAGTVDATSVSFDFDYDGNVQGGRTAGTDAAVVIRAIGLETAQFVEASGTITRATGQAFSVVSSLERNYTNP
jgi:hypothetical protein